MKLTGKGAVVTGGGRGIGAAVARALSAEGARVVVAARTRDEIDAVANDLRRDGAKAWAIRCDVTRPADIRRLAREAARRLGTLDILVNNAGAASSAPLDRITLKEWQRLLAVNATSTFLVTQAILPGMVRRRTGRVVNIASVVGLAGARYIAAYSASKHAVLGLTRCVAAEIAASGVTINAVCPGYVNTDMTDQTLARIQEKTGMSREKALEAILRQTPQGRLVEPEEVAYAVLALCDERARGINGQTIVIDGGGLLA